MILINCCKTGNITKVVEERCINLSAAEKRCSSSLDPDLVGALHGSGRFAISSYIYKWAFYYA